MPTELFYSLYLLACLYLLQRLLARFRLSRAKHRSLAGHPRLSRLFAKVVPYYAYNDERFFNSDNAPDVIAQQRRNGFKRLQQYFQERLPLSIEMNEAMENGISDIQFINSYRVPFQYRKHVRKHLKIDTLVEVSSGTQIMDIDGNWSYDLAGSYGVNIFGYDFYKRCIAKGFARVQKLGPVLGTYHPVVAENVEKLKMISGLDAVSFHMSGTEAVMQAVRLARFHTGKSHLVRFCGAYHGWWDGVQPGIGNNRRVSDVYTLKDMHRSTLQVLNTRKDIACVLVNPMQALHPNANVPGDAMLVSSARHANFNREAYTDWLQELRQVCSKRSIVMIIDEIFVGFRLAYRGAQEYFKVQADMVTYGKSLGGGLPVGVLCGRASLMKRYREDRPTDICFARGTFNSHPYVMGAMNEFLRRIEAPDIQKSYATVDTVWDRRTHKLNNRLSAKGLPVRIANLASVWMVIYETPSRYNWMFQYYLRAQGLASSWIGTGRFIMSHDYTDEDMEMVMHRFTAAAEAMQADGWWWQGEELTNKSIKKQILRELITKRISRRYS